MDLVLYVGLPKTATTFYELNLFPLIDGEQIIFNPKPMEKLSYLLDSNYNPTESEITEFHREIDLIKEKNPDKVLLLINEHLGYWGWSLDSKNGVLRTKKLFPKAKIIICFRHQTDWMLSLYKHSVDTGGGFGGIARFLNYHNGSFLEETPYKETNMTNYRDIIMNVREANWSLYLDRFHESYGKENVNVIFFEDFIKDKHAYTKKLCKIIGITNEIPKINYKSQTNKGPSALTCYISQIQRRILHILKLKPRNIQRWNEIVESQSLSRKESPQNYTSFIVYFFKSLYFMLRYAPLQFYLKLMDELIYINWDIFGSKGIRQNLDDIYKEINRDLPKFVDNKEIPEKYLR